MSRQENFSKKMGALTVDLNKAMIALEEFSMAKIGMSKNNDQEEMNLQKGLPTTVWEKLAELKRSGELDWEELVKKYEKTYSDLRRSHPCPRPKD